MHVMTINAVAVFCFYSVFFLAPAHSASAVDPEWFILDPDPTSSTFSDPDPSRVIFMFHLKLHFVVNIYSVKIHFDPDSFLT